MGQIIDRASSPLFLTNTQKKVEEITQNWTVETIVSAANVAKVKYFNTRRNYSLTFDEFITLPFFFLYRQPTNESESVDNLERVWALFVNGGFEDDEIDEDTGEIIYPTSWNNVHIDGLQFFSSILWVLPRRSDDRDKLFATFTLFDFSNRQQLSEIEVITLLSCCLSGLHIFTEGFVLLPRVDHLQFIVQHIFENVKKESYSSSIDKHNKKKKQTKHNATTRIDYPLFVQYYDEMEQTSIDALLLADVIRITREPGGMKGSDRWQGTRDSWMESFLFSSIDEKLFKAKWYDNPDPDVRNRKALPPPPTTQADIDTWHDVLSVLKEDGLRDTLADLDASELDVSDMMFLQDRDIELLTLYLTFNNYKQLYTVNVSHCQLKGAGTELLVSGLVLNQTVKYLYCSDNNMGLEGAKALASYLANNDVLKTLDIGVNNIGRNGGKQLAGVFIEGRNHTLQTLNVRGNNLGRAGGIAFGKAIGSNPKCLTALNLKDNGIDAAASIGIGLGIEKNNLLTNLDLSKNRIYDEGIIAIVNSLKKNIKTPIGYLNIGYNSIKARGAKSVAELLKENKTLTELSLAANKLGIKYYEAPVRKPVSTNLRNVPTQMLPHAYSTEGIESIVNAMENNKILKKLDLSMNYIDTVSSEHIFNTFIERKCSNLDFLNLSGNEISHDMVIKFKQIEKARRKEERARKKNKMLKQKEEDNTILSTAVMDIPKIDISQQIRMRSHGSIPMQVPVRTWKDTTDESVGEGALSTLSLGRTNMKLKNLKERQKKKHEVIEDEDEEGKMVDDDDTRSAKK